MNRLYVVESMPTVTGAKAEHRLGLKPSRHRPVRHALSPVAAASPATSTRRSSSPPCRPISRSPGASRRHPRRDRPRPPFTPPPTRSTRSSAPSAQLSSTPSPSPISHRADCRLPQPRRCHEVGPGQGLVMLGGNPIYSAPLDLGFGDALGQVPYTVHMGRTPMRPAPSALAPQPGALPRKLGRRPQPTTAPSPSCSP